MKTIERKDLQWFSDAASITKSYFYQAIKTLHLLFIEQYAWIGIKNTAYLWIFLTFGPNYV